MANPRSRPDVLLAVLSALLGSSALADGPQPVAPPVSVPAPAAPGAPASDSGGPVPGAAQRIQDWCQKDYPDKCQAMAGLLNDQTKLYGDVSACANSNCGYDQLFALDGRAVALNEQVAALMSQVGQTTDKCEEMTDHTNDFYRMQSALRQGLAAAWTTTLAAAGAAPSPDAQAAQTSATNICDANPGQSPCWMAQISAAEARQFETINAACEKKPCQWQESKQLLSDFLLLKNHSDKLQCVSSIAPAKVAAADLNAVGKSVVNASNIMFLTTKGVTGGLDDADKQEKALDEQITAGMIAVQSGDKSLSPAEVAAMESALNGIGGNVNSKSLMIDEMDRMMTGEANGAGKSMTATFTGPLRTRVDGENEAYAALRARLKALRTAAGFSFPTNYDQGLVEWDPSSTPAAATPGKSAPAPLSPAPAARPLDASAVPSLTGPSVAAPAILPNSDTPTQKLRMLVSPDPNVQADVQADMMRRSGLTQTVGDPGRRAGLVYPQASPDACGIVAEQEVLRAYGKVPATDPVKQQAALRAEAAEAGIFEDGTPSDLSGALLEKYHLPTNTVNHGTLDQLNAAVMTGDFVVVSVDARPLWAPNHEPGHFDNSPVLAHNILITGAEVSKVDGHILGYYINDSGAIPGHNVYFAPAEMFQQAWNGDTKSFVQVLR